MAKVNANIPQGTRDFGPEVVRKRNYIFNTIRNVFEIYGFQPLETPAMENIETLMGKYGEEGDKLIFRVLDSGTSFTFDFFSELFEGVKNFVALFNAQDKEKLKKEFDIDEFEPLELKKTSPKIFAYIAKELLSNKELSQVFLPKLKNEISEKALKYDLTIPFARYVAMNFNQLTFPFKRYQIQPVWRADRPQRSRYREFYQCDADVIGSNSLLNEVELALIYHEVFTQLRITDYELRINSRKILSALAEVCGGKNKMTDITVAIDKLDKIGLEKVKDELKQKGLSKNQLEIIEKYLSISGTNENKLAAISELVGKTEAGKKGIEELAFVTNTIAGSQLTTPDLPRHRRGSQLTIDFTLARGLDYYTGIIFEAKAPEKIKIGSIGGGGRYDDLTGLFGVPGVSGVGISFGVDRIYDVMEELNLFPADVHVGTKVLFFNMGEKESKTAFVLMQQLRNKGISSELYHEPVKLDKQFKYAEKKNIPYVVIIGSKEVENKTCTVKDLKTGTQETIAFENLPDFSLFCAS